MRTFACVVGAKSASWRSGVCDAIRPHHNLPILQNSPILQIHLYFQLPLMGGRIALKGRANCPQRKGELPTMDGRIAHNGWANCNSPLHVRYPNVGKYTYKSCKYTKKKTSWAWYEGVCVCRRGELQFAHTTICPYCISNILRIHLCGRANCNSPTPQFAHIAKFTYVANSSTS